MTHNDMTHNNIFNVYIMEKNIGKVIFMNLPNIKRPQYRWIIKKRDDGRYITRVPKTNVLLRELKMKRDSDYGKEVLLPIGAKPYVSPKVVKSKRKFKNAYAKKTIKKFKKNPK